MEWNSFFYLYQPDIKSRIAKFRDYRPFQTRSHRADVSESDETEASDNETDIDVEDADLSSLTEGSGIGGPSGLLADDESTTEAAPKARAAITAVNVKESQIKKKPI